MDVLKRWFWKIVFIIVPSVILILLFAALLIDMVGEKSMGMAYSADDIVALLTLFLPFILLGAAALMISVQRFEKCVKIIKWIAGGLFVCGAFYLIYDLIFQLPRLQYDFPLPLERCLRIAMLAVFAVSCFLPDRFLIAKRVCAIAGIVAYLVMSTVPDIVYGYDYITVIKDNIVEVGLVPFSFISLIITSFFFSYRAKAA